MVFVIIILSGCIHEQEYKKGQVKFTNQSVYLSQIIKNNPLILKASEMSYKSSLVIFTILFAITQFGSSASTTEECEHTHINGSGQILFGTTVANNVLVCHSN